MEYKKATACGKLILIGEHSVLQGGAAVAIPFADRACVLKVRSAKDNQWHIKPRVTAEVLALFKAGWRFVVQGTELEDKTWEIVVDFSLPPGGGFGMSASWSVALVRWAQIMLAWDQSTCLAKLQELENLHHGGVASGIDHLTIWHEAPQMLVAGQVSPVKIPTELIDSLSVFYTGRPDESTAEMIKKVEDSRDNPFFLNKNFIQSGGLVSKADFLALINQAGESLEKAGAVNPDVAQKMSDFRAQGGVVKVCGAGGYKAGSGAAVAWHEDKAVLAEFLNQFEVV